VKTNWFSQAFAFHKFSLCRYNKLEGVSRYLAKRCNEAAEGGDDGEGAEEGAEGAAGGGAGDEGGAADIMDGIGRGLSLAYNRPLTSYVLNSAVFYLLLPLTRPLELPQVNLESSE
jgi:hypothetical protein